MSTWILLRGWARESRHWEDFPARLEAALPAARAMTLDLPGAGERRHESSPLSVRETVRALRGELGCRASTDRASLLGLSFGGMVAIEWARAYPDEVERLVVVNTSARPFCRAWHRLRPGNYARVARLMASRADAAREAAILTLTTSARDEGRIERWTRYAAERPMSRANALRQLVAAARYRASARAPSVPTLVLASAGDRLVDARCSRELARAWGVAFALHADAGHDLAVDDGPWVAAQVARWIRPT
ncbi:MAG TPA: alpha/beta hydrolase [Usitatibacter sp.]|jgi:pimeloyl-ACP methyl ester carboxylesterase|nr:alpha/beta hydrolase [Usitatibacter sp.]